MNQVETNQFPVTSKIGMVFTTYTDHMPFMKYALTQYRQVEDMFILGAFDPRLVTQVSHQRNIPYGNIWSLAHAWVTKHYTFGGHAKRHGWIWSHIYAYGILRLFDFDWIISANGDCCWEKPQGIYEILDMMDSKEIHFMSGQSFTRHTDKFNFIHTCSMIFSQGAYWDFISFVMDKVFGEEDTVSFSPEGLIQQWLGRDDFWKWEHAPIQPKYPNGDHDFYCECHSDSTWKNVLGFRNLEAEKTYRQENKLEPLDPKYFDMRDEKWYKDQDKGLLKYYKTGDRIHLNEWWNYFNK